MDIFGNAVLDYQKGQYTEDLLTYSSLGEEGKMPLPYLFRKYKNMPALEQKALQLCQGKILDIGCGAGSHSLYLQKKGFEVTALDASKGAIETCKLRGIKDCIHIDILKYDHQKFDTLLLLMNGIGVAGEFKKLGSFLKHLKKLLKPNGQILLDSTDIIYMFETDEEENSIALPMNETYYGEVQFTISYKNNKSTPFSWLYIDQERLYEIANENQLNCEIVSLGDHYDYLAKLSPQIR